MFPSLYPNWPYLEKELRGASLAEAFQRTGDPDLLRQLDECDRNIRALSGQDGAEPKLAFYRQQQAQIREALEKRFVAMLLSEKLVASGFVDPIGPTSERIVIKHDLWEFLVPDITRSTATAFRERIGFVRVHIFRGLPAKEDVTEEANGHPQQTDSVGWRRGQDPEFTHTPDYTLVTMRGHQFTLGAAAAAIVRQLHRASLRGKPVLSERELMEGTAQSRIDTLFNRKKEPSWKELIRKAGRGHYELNLTVPAEQSLPGSS